MVPSFSVVANATDVNNLSNDINFRFFSLDEYPGIPKQYGHTPYVTNNDLPLNFEYNLINLMNKFPNGNFNHYDIFDFAYINSNKINTTELYNGDKIILNKGENFKASVSVVGSYFLAKNSTGYIINQFPLYQNNSFKVYFDLYDGSGNFVSVDAEDFEINFKEYNNGSVGTAAYYNISASLSDVPFDVYGIRLITVSNAIDSFGGNLGSAFVEYKAAVLNNQYDLYRYVNIDSFTLVVDDSNKSVLNSIVSWLSNIKENLTNGLSNVSNGLTNLGNRINTFFTNLGSTITTNFNSLITNFKNNITSLGDRFSSFITSLGDRISGFFSNLTNSIKGFFDELKQKIDLKIDEIKQSIHDFFVPPEGFFEDWKAKFDLMLSDNLGFVYQAPNFVIQVIYCIQDVLNTKTEPELVFPKIEFDIVGYHVLLFEDAKVDFSFLDTGIWSILYGMYKVMVHAILIFALIKLAQDTWERTMEN